MRCPEPGVHKSEGGGYLPAVFLLVALFFVAFGWAVNVLLGIVLTAGFVLAAGVVTMLLIRAHRHILGGGAVRYVPQMQTPQPRLARAPAPQQPPALDRDRQFLMFLATLSPAERDHVVRQLGGGR